MKSCRRGFLAGIPGLLAWGAACQREVSSNPERSLLATTGLVADLVRKIAGPWWEVQSLMGPGIDPHTFEPSYGALRRLTSAKMVFFHGLHLEGKMAEVLHRLEEREPARYHAVTSQIPASRILGESLESPDPHVWMDAALWSECLGPITKALCEADPENARDYLIRHAETLDSMVRLDDQIRRLVLSIPPQKRILVTAHDAFAYFGRAYGFRVEGVQGISTTTEATLNRLEEVADILVENKIGAVFLESSVNPRTLTKIREIAKRLDHNSHVAAGGTLYSDSLGDPGSGAETHKGMMLANVQTLVEALR